MSEIRAKVTGAYVIETPDADKRGDYLFLDTFTLQLYYWPESAIKAGPTAAELAECTSNTQRNELLDPWFSIGQKVEFEVLNERRGIVTKVRKYGNVIHEYAAHQGVPGLSFKTTCFLSDAEVKQCYSTHLQYVVVDQEYVKDAMALVPFNAYVAIDVDKNNLHCTFHLRCFDIHKPVAVKSREAAESVPWHTPRTSEALPFYEGEDFVEPTEVDLWKESMKNDFDPKELLEGSGFYVSAGEIYCKATPFWRVKVPWTAPEYRLVRWQGRVVKFDAYYSKLNKCYVVYNWRETHLPIDIGGTELNALQGGNVVTFKASVLRRSAVVGVYWNAHVGYIRDEARVLEAFRTAPDEPVWTYVKYNFTTGLFKFSVDRIAPEHHPEGTQTLQKEFHGIAVVTGFGGQLYAPELYDRMLLLPSNLRDQYGPGQYVDVSAVCNAETGIFEVSEAVAVNTTSLHAASNNERTEAVLKVRVSFVKEHPLYFFHKDFGPIRAIHKYIISAARFKNIEPVIKILDAYGKDGNDGCRFKCVGVERTGFFQSTA